MQPGGEQSLQAAERAVSRRVGDRRIDRGRGLVDGCRGLVHRRGIDRRIHRRSVGGHARPDRLELRQRVLHASFVCRCQRGLRVEDRLQGLRCLSDGGGDGVEIALFDCYECHEVILLSFDAGEGPVLSVQPLVYEA